MPSLPDLTQLSHAQKDELIRMLRPLQQQVQELMAQMLAMQERIRRLEGRLGKNSKNSSKPPSTDGLNKPAPKSLRKSGQNPNGGQKGHSGCTLRQSAQIDETIAHLADTRCSACQREMVDHAIAETRQVLELPSWAFAPWRTNNGAPPAPAGPCTWAPGPWAWRAVQGSGVVHADETGIRVKGRLHWLHCAVTSTLTWLAPARPARHAGL